MRFNNRSRGLLLVKSRLVKGRPYRRASFLPLNRRRRHVAEMQTGFFTVDVGGHILSGLRRATGGLKNLRAKDVSIIGGDIDGG
jgi:hypothetical protein